MKNLLVAMLCTASVATMAAESAESVTASCTTTGVEQRTVRALDRFMKQERLKPYFDEAYGYAIFPNVGRAGAGAGGAYGRGLVYQGGAVVGCTSVWQFFYGAMIGAELYSQVIFFKDQAALAAYQKQNFEFTGRAGVAFLMLGATANPAFNSGVAVFSMTKFGVLVELTPGASYYTFEGQAPASVP